MRLPCILITAKGFPDLATRFRLSASMSVTRHECRLIVVFVAGFSSTSYKRLSHICIFLACLTCRAFIRAWTLGRIRLEPVNHSGPLMMQESCRIYDIYNLQIRKWPHGTGSSSVW